MDYSLDKEFPIRKKPLDYEATLPMTSIEKGDDLVNWVSRLFNDTEFSGVIKDSADISGLSNGKFDLIFRLLNDDLPGVIRGIQVKCISQISNVGDRWVPYIKERQNYPPDTLMIFVNMDKTRFACGLWQKFTKPIMLNFSNIADQEIMFKDLQRFKLKLSTLMAQATVIDDIAGTITSLSNRKEFDSLRMIKQVCESRQIRFEYHWTTNSSTDIYLNGRNCQCKSSSCFDHLLCYFSVKKSNGGKCKKSYSLSDGIDYFVFNIISDRYKNDICIIPIKVLLDNHKIETDTEHGPILGLAPPNHFEYHWCESMWNNFELLNNPTITDPIYLFINKYKVCIKNSSTKYRKYSFMIRDYDIACEYFLFFLNNRINRLYTDYILCITKDDLVMEGQVPRGNQILKKIYIAPPDYVGQHWSVKYWKKILDWKVGVLPYTLTNSPKKIYRMDQYPILNVGCPALREIDYLQFRLDFLKNILKLESPCTLTSDIASVDNLNIGSVLIKELHHLQQLVAAYEKIIGEELPYLTLE
jgi:hypothetical protein